MRDNGGSSGLAHVADTSSFLTGFSHGAAIALPCLLRLHRMTGDPRFREAAFEALAYGAACSCPASAIGRPSFAGRNQFARTAVSMVSPNPPVSVSLVGCLDSVADADIAAEIESALTTTLNAAFISRSLCCGNFGHLQFLLCAGRAESRRTRHDWRERLRRN
jgi:lantibiotic modifying enzyme